LNHQTLKPGYTADAKARREAGLFYFAGVRSRGPDSMESAGVEGMAKRKIFDELVEGIAAMKSQRKGKITLRTYEVEPAPLPKVDSKLIRDTRKRLHCSRAVFARRLRINERTLEKWEQGRAKPNPRAAALVLLVRKFPDTLERLERVAAGR
jgi:putative transcriptional regulator